MKSPFKSEFNWTFQVKNFKHISQQDNAEKIQFEKCFMN